MTRVLVVDDKDENLYYLEALLRAQGYVVDVARHGAEALVLARMQRPDLVVSDLLMPVMDGYTLLRHWKSDPALRDAPFLVYTATYTEADDERLALSLGADAFILKPAEPEDFLDRLREVHAGKPRDGNRPAVAADESDLLKLYSETLIRKLEEKTLQLEQANRVLAADIEQRRRTEEILRVSEANLAAAQRIAQFGSWELDLGSGDMDANALRWSDEMFRIAGMEPQSRPISNAVFFALIPEAEREPIRTAMRNALDRREPYSIVHRLVRADGEVRIVHERAQLFVDEHGMPSKLIGTAHDITEQRKADEALLASERAQRQLAAQLEIERARLLDAQRVAKIGSWETDVASGEVTWSDETHRIFETEPSSFRPTQERFLGFVHPDDRERIAAALDESLREGNACVIEHRLRMDDGRVKFVEECWQLFQEPGRGARRLIGTCRDITGQRLAEAETARAAEAIRTSEERFRLLSRATKDAIWDWDLQSNALWWNEGFEDLFGYRREDVEPGIESWTRRIHPDDHDGTVASIHAVIDSGAETWQDTYRFRRADGSYAWVSDRGQVIRDADGKAVRMVGGVVDQSERLALEEQLRQSQRLEAVGQLTGGVAHDFNNLLTVILGNAELLAEHLAMQPALAGMADMVVKAALRGAELTQRLLAFARKQALDPRPVDANSLLAGLDGLLRRTLGSHVEINIKSADALWPALVDPAQLENAVLNLCLNARDAMPGGGWLAIETANVHLDASYVDAANPGGGGDYVMLAISDAGVGIPPEHLRRVFEPFFTTKHEGKGTGLGLAMVYGFVKQSGGHVYIYSEPGQGTTVKLYLPRASDPAVAIERIDDHRSVTGGDETVLLVEDDELVRRYASDQLRELGYSVIEAGNGADALEIVRGEPSIALLFTDVVMPGISGRQLADEALALRPGLRVLYCSGYTDDAIVHHGRLDAGVQLLSKPYRHADLADAVRKALS